MTETVFKPRLLPHSVVDALLSLCIGLFQALLLFVLPSLLCYWVFGSTSLALLTALGDSVAHGGYDYFHRSSCEPNHCAKLHVLDGGLLPDGDERIAKEWAANFAEKGRVLYLAYCAGERRVDVCEITDHNAMDYQPPTNREKGFITAAVIDPFGNILGIMYNPHYLEVLRSSRKA
jgi:hypothetical protein